MMHTHVLIIISSWLNVKMKKSRKEFGEKPHVTRYLFFFVNDTKKKRRKLKTDRTSEM